MSREKSLAELLKTKIETDSVSPSFCAAKWTQTTLHLHNGLTHSCHHPYPHKINLSEIEKNPAALHNTEQKITARKEMLSGLRPSECQYCWTVEDSASYKNNELVSDRILKTSEDWSQERVSEIIRTPLSKNFAPSYLEVSFSNTCNMKCSYCSPIFSTRWREEADRFGPYPTSQNFNNSAYLRSTGELADFAEEANPYVTAFWKWWPELSSHLRVLRITGGEPLMSADTFKLFEMLSSNPLPQLDLAINSNASLPHELFDRFVLSSQNLVQSNSVSTVKLFTSLDGFGTQAEYARFGLNFSLWQRNIEKFLSSFQKPQLTIMCTTNIFSLPRLEKLLRYVLQLKSRFPQGRITIDTNILRYPHHLSLRIANDDLRNTLDDSLKFVENNTQSADNNGGFLPIELIRLKRVVEYLKNDATADEKIHLLTARKDFKLFVDEHDRRRGTNFRATFPELENFYKICT